MEHDELMEMLDLGAKVKPVKQTTEVELDEEWSEEHAPQETTIKLDEWDEVRGIELNEKLRRDVNVAAETCDFFAMAYKSEPELHEVCKDQRRQQFIEGAMSSPEYKVLRQNTLLNEMTSEMAAKEFIDKYEVLKQQDKKNENLSPRQERQMPKELRDEASLDSAIHGALASAQEQIEEVMECARGLGVGGSNDGKMDAKRTIALYHRVRNNHRLKMIIDRAGRYRRLAQSKQRTKVTHGKDEMVGIELAGDISRLVPLEMVMITDDDFEMDAIRRLVENQSMCYEYKGIEKLGKGPIVICIDESGSMDGEPIAQAKAFALAMAWIARQQRRFCILSSFSDSYAGRYIVLPPNKWDETKLCDWLSSFYGGGTDVNYPLNTIPSMWDKLGVPKGKTDMILITDGELSVPEVIRKSFLEFKQREKVKLTSLIISYAPGSIQHVSDDWHLINGIDVSDVAVGKCLSV
jgi:uncharacterized protein with von Willebrand factor type A (vWA) domain